MTSSGLRVAVVGATGAVGRELLTILEEPLPGDVRARLCVGAFSR